MKQTGRAFSAVFLVALCLFCALLPGCSAAKSALPDGYLDHKEYLCNDKEKFTEYGWYLYGQKAEALFAADPDFSCLREAELPYIVNCIDGFSSWVAHSDFADAYAFGPQLAAEGDYYSLYTRDGTTNNLGDMYDRYTYFTLLYYDVSAHTLYYLHNRTY